MLSALFTRNVVAVFNGTVELGLLLTFVRTVALCFVNSLACKECAADAAPGRCILIFRAAFPAAEAGGCAVTGEHLSALLTGAGDFLRVVLRPGMVFVDTNCAVVFSFGFCRVLAAFRAVFLVVRSRHVFNAADLAETGFYGESPLFFVENDEWFCRTLLDYGN